MKTIKYSRQREAILNFLKTRRDHPTAEIIYSNLREAYPNLSIGTVYRNLNLLSENGEILKISLEDDSAHFDAFTHPHCHFFCKECKSLSDIKFPSSNMASIEKCARKNFDGEIHSYSSVFYGLCKNCIENRKSVDTDILL